MKLCPYDDPQCDFRIDSMKKTDFAKIGTFFEKTFPHMKNHFPLWQKYIKHNGQNIVIKNAHGKIKGFMNIEKQNNYRNINFIAVDPSISRKGIGTKMLNLAEIKFNDVRHFSLDTEGNKIQNMRFYSKNGWVVHSVDPKGYEHTTSVRFLKKI